MRAGKNLRPRRILAGVAGLCALSALAACGTVHTAGESAGASVSGASYLAEIRSTHGLPTLAYDPALERTALEQAAYMAGSRRMTHTTGWRRDFASRIRKNGIERAAAENIAHGRMNLDELFEAWMNSQGHRRNMLDPRFTRFGLAYARENDGSGRRYWALVVSR
jgi:uncharacterized protein YkwD